MFHLAVTNGPIFHTGKCIFLSKILLCKIHPCFFSGTMRQIKKGDVVYCDPPYAPLSNTAYFTGYASGGFNWEQQIELAEWARKLSGQGIKVVISNHNIKSITDLYKNGGAAMEQFKVTRTISCLANNRVKVGELLAVFQP
jgi:DNA adenine methylase